MKAKFYNPDKTEDQFDIHIDRNGQWYHRGTPMNREKMAHLFSTVLHYDIEKNEYWLITPHEQGRITVEDVPYVITDYKLGSDTLTLTTNLGDTVAVSKDHPITCDPETGIAYVVVKNNARGRLNRAVRDQLINLALEQGGYNDAEGVLYFKSGNDLYPIAVDTDR